MPVVTYPRTGDFAHSHSGHNRLSTGVFQCDHFGAALEEYAELQLIQYSSPSSYGLLSLLPYNTNGVKAPVVTSGLSGANPDAGCTFKAQHSSGSEHL